MARGISQTFLADVTPFLAGTSDMETALEDVADSLDDLVRESSTSADKMGDAFAGASDEMAREASTAADKMEADFKSAWNAASTEADTSSRATSTHVRRAADDTKRAADEVKESSKGNMAETLSSFDGSIDGFVSGVQGTFGELSGVLGPAGAIGAGFLAAGVGIAKSLFDKAKERRKEFQRQMQETVNELASQLLEANGKISKEFRDQKMQEWILGLGDKFDDVQTKAEALGLSVATLARAKFGDPVAIKAVNDALAEQQRLVTENTEKANKDIYRTSQGYHDAAAAIADANDNITFLTDNVGDYQLALGDAKSRTDQVKAATTLWGEALGDIPAETTSNVNVDTSKADGDLDAWQKTPRFLDVEVKPVLHEEDLRRISTQIAGAVSGFRWEAP